jgi:hypothetical protein
MFGERRRNPGAQGKGALLADSTVKTWLYLFLR